jgi:hypothetical protein
MVRRSSLDGIVAFRSLVLLGAGDVGVRRGRACAGTTVHEHEDREALHDDLESVRAGARTREHHDA